MNFRGLESPDSEVESQAAMQNTKVLNPDCECNYVWLEITLRCRVSIPGSRGQHAAGLCVAVLCLDRRAPCVRVSRQLRHGYLIFPLGR